MNTDCAFYIGTTHEVCQDYALANSNSVVVSDGCSGSKNSDIGSRILSITAMNKIKEIDSMLHFDEKECILLARPSIKMLNVPNECLDATLLAAVDYGEGAEAQCFGDGVIAIKMKSGETIIIDCAYTDSYPFYMNYLYDQTGRYNNWKENHNKRQIFQTVMSPDWEVISHTPAPYRSRLFEELGIIRAFDNKIVVELSDKDSIEYLSIMTDGIHSFYEKVMTDTSKYNKNIYYTDVLKELLTFKNFNSSFVQRRMNKFRKDCVKKNWANADDFSLAVIYFGD